MSGWIHFSVYLLKTRLDWGLGLFWEQMSLAWDQKNLKTAFIDINRNNINTQQKPKNENIEYQKTK